MDTSRLRSMRARAFFAECRVPGFAVRSHDPDEMTHPHAIGTDSAAIVVSDLSETLVQNRVAIAPTGEEPCLEGLDRNLIWRWFTDPAMRPRFRRKTDPRSHARRSQISARPPRVVTAMPASSNWSNS